MNRLFPFLIPLLSPTLLALIPALVVASADNPTREELLQTVRHIASLAKETQAELDAEKSAHASTEAALAGALKANQDTQSQFASYQAAAEVQIKKGNDAVTALNHVIKKLHLAKYIMCGLWLAVAAWVALQLPGPLKLYVGGALAAAGIAAIWIWL